LEKTFEQCYVQSHTLYNNIMEFIIFYLCVCTVLAQRYVTVHNIMYCTHSSVHGQKYVTVHNIVYCTHSFCDLKIIHQNLMEYGKDFSLFNVTLFGKNF
jgi:hypothetical protein